MEDDGGTHCIDESFVLSLRFFCAGGDDALLGFMAGESFINRIDRNMGVGVFECFDELLYGLGSIGVGPIKIGGHSNHKRFHLFIVQVGIEVHFEVRRINHFQGLGNHF